MYVSAFAQALYIDEYHNSHGLPGDLKGELSVVSVKVVYFQRRWNYENCIYICVFYLAEVLYI